MSIEASANERMRRCGPLPEQCPACGSELLHPEPICQDCGATTGDDEDD